MQIEKKVATLGGGCFWCLEAVFEQLKGVEKVESGYSGGAVKNPTYKEVGTGMSGHAEVVQALIDAKAPLDHVNNLGWTAVMEAVVLGDGGQRHQQTLKALLDAGANARLPDRDGVTPLDHAKRRGYAAMVQMLSTTGKY